MTKKQAIKTTGFIFVALLLIGLTGELLRDKSTTLSSLYSAKNNTVDVFIVGSSHVNSGYIPAILWEEYGISAHNVYSWSQPMWTSYYYIKEAMKTQKPKAVVVDLNGLMYGNSIEQPKETDRVNYLNSFTIDPGLNFLSFIQTVKSCGIDLKNPIDFLNIVRFHTRWKYIDEKTFTYNAHKDYDYLKGYGLQVGVHSMTAPDYPLYEGEPSLPYEKAIEYLEKTVKLSQEKTLS